MNGPADAPVTIGISRQSPTARQDRLATTLFLAAVLHGMLIAGITFGIDGGTGAAPGLEVVRSADRGPDEPRDDPAAYLAETSQRGSGTTRERVAADLPLAPPAGAAGEADARSVSGAAANGSADAVLGSSAARLEVRFVAATPGAAPSAAAGEVSLPGVQRQAVAVEARLTARTPAETDGFVPDTQSSIVAPYLDEWRRKVERLGTLNYPGIARRLDTRVSPVLAVELGADGRLLRVSIQRSSGQADVDQAALEILRLASPFDPFPRDMARQYPRLRFAYEWRFDRGAARSGEADGAAAYSSP
jgi:protein TonB